MWFFYKLIYKSNIVPLKIRSFYNWAKQANPNFHVKSKQEGIYYRASELVNMWFGEGGVCDLKLHNRVAQE